MSYHDDRRMAELSAFVHGVLAGLHVLGIAYNLRKRNWFDVFMHTSAAIYDVHSMHSHVNDCHD